MILLARFFLQNNVHKTGKFTTKSGILAVTVPVKINFPLCISKTLQSRLHVGKKTFNDLKKRRLFITHRSFFYLTVVYFLLIYARITICAENLFYSTYLLQGLALKQHLFFLFGFFVASLFVSGCIQTFASASRRCRFHCRQPLRHSLSPVTAFSFSHFCFSRLRLAIQLFTSPSCRRCRLLSRFVVSSSASHSFTSACRRPRRPATRFYFSFS